MVDKIRFRQLYLDHYPGVKTFFLSKGFPPEDAEELTQDVFLRVYKYRGDFRGKGSIHGWLGTISANMWKNRIRELRSLKRDAVVVPLDSPRPTADLFNEPCGQPLPDEHAIRQEQRQLLRRAVAKLHETVYACVVLRVYHELSYREIARVLQLPYETVKSRLYQAQNKLIEILDEDMGIDFQED